VANTNFRYGVRSIAHLVELIPFRKEAVTLSAKQLGLPFSSAADLKQSSLAYHLLHHEQADGVLAMWKQARMSDAQMPIEVDFVSRAVSAVGEPDDREAAIDVLWRFHTRFPSAPLSDSFTEETADSGDRRTSKDTPPGTGTRRHRRPKSEGQPLNSGPRRESSPNGDPNLSRRR
jgi:hypothetical protein